MSKDTLCGVFEMLHHDVISQDMHVLRQQLLCLILKACKSVRGWFKIEEPFKNLVVKLENQQFTILSTLLNKYRTFYCSQDQDYVKFYCLQFLNQTSKSRGLHQQSS